MHKLLYLDSNEVIDEQTVQKREDFKNWYKPKLQAAKIEGKNEDLFYEAQTKDWAKAMGKKKEPKKKAAVSKDLFLNVDDHYPAEHCNADSIY